jgi:anti-sigma28 factor (negative regulator of flagellin synthesis)
MARVTAVSKLQPANHRKFPDARHGQRHSASAHDKVLTGQICENVNTTPRERALKRIVPLAPIRQGKVRDIRRQIADGTYEMGDRLDRAIDRVLEALTT